MKFITLILSPTLLFFAACTENESDDSTSSASSATSTTETKIPDSAIPGSSSAVSDLVGSASDLADAKPGSSDLNEISGFSKTISSTWDSMKGMDFAKKAEFVKKGLALVSEAKDKISLLQTLSKSLPDGTGEKLLSQAGGLSGNITGLSDLFGKAGSIGAGDWSSYKKEIGSAIGLLGGGFSGLGSL